MSVTQGYIKNANFSAVINPDSVQPLSELFTFKLPINFDQVSDVTIYSGKYTPNNDFFYIFNGMLAAKAPNFLIFTCDRQMNVYMQKASGSAPIYYLPIIRFGFFSWLQDDTDFVNLLLIDGRTSITQPMIQGEQIAYTIIAGRGIIS